MTGRAERRRRLREVRRNERKFEKAVAALPDDGGAVIPFPAGWANPNANPLADVKAALALGEERMSEPGPLVVPHGVVDQAVLEHDGDVEAAKGYIDRQARHFGFDGFVVVEAAVCICGENRNGDCRSLGCDPACEVC